MRLQRVARTAVADELGDPPDASPAVTASVCADFLEANREVLGANLAQAGFGA